MTDKETAIIVRDLHKEFILPQHKNTSIKQTVVNISRNKGKVTQRVLDGISFEVNKGDFFGIVGRNGSGKSTLLKLLAGVYSPTAGEIIVNGGLTPFIELGVGFNPELSGRDNVFLNGALLGFDRKEMEEMYEEIVDFAELEQFMDQKLKNYSSGMQVRLAFSIAIKAHNEILIFDEVLAVGDQAFQRKCLDVFEKYKASKQTVILVTHDMDTVKKFCNRAILLSEGKLIEEGEPYLVANHYSKLNQAEIDRDILNENAGTKQSSLTVDVVSASGQSQQTFQVGETMSVMLSWKAIKNLDSVGVNIFKISGEHITGYNSKASKSEHLLTDKGFCLEFKLNVTPGKYYLLVEAYTKDGQLADAILDGPRFSVVSKHGPNWSGLFPLEHTWKRKVVDKI